MKRVLKRVSNITAQSYTVTVILALYACVFLCSASLGATRQQQTQASFPADMVSIDPNLIPRTCGGVLSMALFPDGPPYPPVQGCWQDYGDVQWYWSASLGTALFDDRASFAMQALSDPPPVPGGTNGYYDPSGEGIGTNPTTNNYGTNLFLVIPWQSNGVVCVGLSNTHGGVLYNLVSSTAIGKTSCTNWLSECLLWGATNANATYTTVDLANRTNIFFWAYSISSDATVVTLNSMKSATGFVNNVGASFPYGDSVSVQPILYSLDMGYDGFDRTGLLYPTGIDPFAYEGLDAQGVTSISLAPSAKYSLTNLLVP